MKLKNLIYAGILGIASLTSGLGCKTFAEEVTQSKLGIGGIRAEYGVSQIEGEENSFSKVGITNFISKNIVGYDLGVISETNFQHLNDLEKKIGKLQPEKNAINLKVGAEANFGGYNFRTGLNFIYTGFELDGDNWTGVGNGYYAQVGYCLGGWGMLGIEYASCGFPVDFAGNKNIEEDSFGIFLELRP